ncbi:F-box domain-containing protein [Mycena indigotica]|uniref:F-box domain-containing protein n=1 Tax=Mycena indigotica TaxID=2126181 RepID=A0A8H6W8T2_9AGAR|nr:F-box domain-containing protein [Mycena indigotica]KAF7303459.1 F-box domain-containing protein [Mycena indigotica]
MPESPSPISWLPPELLSKIFYSCLPRNRRVRPHPHRAPLQMAQVSQQWRQVAVSTPALWRSIYLVFPWDHPYDGVPTLFGAPEAEYLAGDVTSLLEVWIARAGALTLSLGIHAFYPLPRELISLIVRYHSRWESLQLMINTADTLEICGLRETFPALTSFFCVTKASQEIEASTPAFLHGAPNLTVLHVPYWRWLDAHVQLTSITALSLFYAPWEGDLYHSLMDVLSSLPALRHLETSYLFPEHPATVGSAAEVQWHTPPLESLLLSGYTSTVLQHLTLPTLRHLQVLITAQAKSQLKAVQNFVARSRCVLSHLSIAVTSDLAAAPGYVEAEIECLACVPSLVTLEFNSMYSGMSITMPRHANDARFAVLCQAESDPAFLPQLRYLLVGDEAGEAVTYETFVNVLDARPAIRFASLALDPIGDVRDLIRPPPQAILDRLQAHRARGVDVQMSTPQLQWPLSTEDDDAPPELYYTEWPDPWRNRTKPAPFFPLSCG